MRHLTFISLLLFSIFHGFIVKSQGINDSLILAEFDSAFEGIIVETYYIADENDASDKDGGSLPEGAVTYRIFIDMKPGYLLGTVIGDQLHELRFETTTEFFNNEDRGEETGNKINASKLGNNTVALDSWITVGAASSAHMGIQKSKDTDGSVVGGIHNDGGSESVPGGLLVNDNTIAGIPLTTADGLVPFTPSEITSVGLDLGVFGDQNAGPVFSATNGGWSVLGGFPALNEDNKVLIAQITTDGELTCMLNFSIFIPDSIRCPKCVTCDSKCPAFINYYYETYPDDSTALENSLFKYHFFERPELAFTLIPTLVEETINPLPAAPDITVYPNPANGFINIRISSETPGSASYSIFDVYGKRLMQKDIGSIMPSHLEQSDISSLAPGIYFVCVRMNESVSYKPIIKF